MPNGVKKTGGSAHANGVRNRLSQDWQAKMNAKDAEHQSEVKDLNLIVTSYRDVMDEIDAEVPALKECDGGTIEGLVDWVKEKNATTPYEMDADVIGVIAGLEEKNYQGEIRYAKYKKAVEQERRVAYEEEKKHALNAKVALRKMVTNCEIFRTRVEVLEEEKKGIVPLMAVIASVMGTQDGKPETPQGLEELLVTFQEFADYKKVKIDTEKCRKRAEEIDDAFDDLNFFDCCEEVNGVVEVY